MAIPHRPLNREWEWGNDNRRIYPNLRIDRLESVGCRAESKVGGGMGIRVVEVSPNQQTEMVGFESLTSKVLVSPMGRRMEVGVYFDL
jgi:hypothetical protein